MRRSVETSAGTIEYQDTGGDGPVLVFLHGLLMNSSVWDGVVERLGADYRCVRPELPFGAHRLALRADADLSLHGIAGLLGEFAAAAELRECTVIGNDWGGAQVMAAGCPERIARLVITPSEAFENFPPGLPGKAAGAAAMNSLSLRIAGRLLRIGVIARLPLMFGWMSKRPVPELLRAWTEPLLTEPGVRANLLGYVRQSNRAEMVSMTERLAEFEKPALVVWASEDKVMPREHGDRLAALLPKGRVEWVDDSYVLMPLDRPDALAELIREFSR